MNDTPTTGLLVQADDFSLRYGTRLAVDALSLAVPAGRVVGLLGHNGAGKTSLLKALVGQLRGTGGLRVLGLDPWRDRVRVLEQVSWIPDVAVLPRWARVHELIRLVAGLHPRFSAERARSLLRRTSIEPGDRVKSLSKGMVAQTHLALAAAIDARLMILDEPTLGLDLLSRKAFYEMLVDEWCDGQRSVIVSTHQVEEIEALLSDVVLLNEGRLALSTSLQDIESRFVALRHDPAVAADMEAAHPLLRYRVAGGSAALFDGEPPPSVLALGQRLRPSLSDLFVALTRRPESTRRHFDTEAVR